MRGSKSLGMRGSKSLGMMGSWSLGMSGKKKMKSLQMYDPYRVRDLYSFFSTNVAPRWGAKSVITKVNNSVRS